MNTTDVAAALHTISQGFRDLAVAIEQPPFRGAADTGRAVVAPARPDTEPEWPPLVDEPHDPVDEPPRVAKPLAVAAEPQGSLAQCPKHRIAYKDGKYGKFCPAQDDEPNWSNAKGYCSITPKNVDVWLRQHSGVPA